jgi:hypothetical protein
LKATTKVRIDLAVNSYIMSEDKSISIAKAKLEIQGVVELKNYPELSYSVVTQR